MQREKDSSRFCNTLPHLIKVFWSIRNRIGMDIQWWRLSRLIPRGWRIEARVGWIHDRQRTTLIRGHHHWYRLGIARIHYTRTWIFTRHGHHHQIRIHHSSHPWKNLSLRQLNSKKFVDPPCKHLHPWYIRVEWEIYWDEKRCERQTKTIRKETRRKARKNNKWISENKIDIYIREKKLFQVQGKKIDMHVILSHRIQRKQ